MQTKKYELMKAKKKICSRFREVMSALYGLPKKPDLTFEQWERLEKKYSPNSSHLEQIYYRESGL